MPRLEIDGTLCDYAFIEADGCLSDADREHFVTETIRMHKKGRSRVELKGEDYEAIVTRGKYAVMGQFGGTAYAADLETNFGKRHASILISKLIDATLN